MHRCEYRPDDFLFFKETTRYHRSIAEVRLSYTKLCRGTWTIPRLLSMRAFLGLPNTLLVSEGGDLGDEEQITICIYQTRPSKMKRQINQNTQNAHLFFSLSKKMSIWLGLKSSHDVRLHVHLPAGLHYPSRLSPNSFFSHPKSVIPRIRCNVHHR